MKVKFNNDANKLIILASLFVFVIWCLVKDYNISKVEGFDSRDDNERRIDNGDWTFFDKVLYGGLGYGNICLPTHLFRIISTIIFPPLGIVIKFIKVTDVFPWIDLGDLLMNIPKLIKSLMLTAFFYVPGLIYSLNELKCPGLDGGSCGD